MRILVTGSAGFIGFHICEELLLVGHDVIGIDNFEEYYYDPSLKDYRHNKLNKYKNYTGINGDVTDYEFLSLIFEKYQFDKVCHLAAHGSVRHSLKDPLEYGNSNLVGHLNILECCRNYKIERLVYASSSSVYGDNKKVPSSEDDQVDVPVSLYGATKKANELMSYSYSKCFGIQTIGLRFFTVYGPAGRPDMAYWLFTDAILYGTPIKAFHNGQISRDFTYIDDITKGIYSSLFTDGLDTYEIINLGNTKVYTVMDMINIISNWFDIEPEIELLPAPIEDPLTTCADIERAKSKLGYNPKTDLKEGLEKFLSWYVDFYN